MPLINLIHEQRALKAQEWRKSRLALSAFIGANVLMTAIAGTLVLATEQVKSDTARINKGLAKIQPMLKDIEGMKLKLAQLKPRLETLQNAQAQTLRWSDILQHLTKSTPEHLWVTEIRSKTGKSTEGVQFTMHGRTMNEEVGGDQFGNQRVSELMSRMQTCSSVDKVDLKFTQQDKLNDHAVLTFEILARVAGTVEEDPKTSKKKAKGFSDKRKDESEASA